MNRPMVTLVVIYCVCVWSTLCFSCIEADPLPHQRQMNTNDTSGNGEALSTGGIFGIVFGVITSIAATIGAIGVIVGIAKGFQRPKITHHPESNKVITAGQTAELKCEASGKPAPNFQWWKAGCDEALADSDDVTIKTGNGHSTLTINNIQKSDAGQYKCKASSLFSCWDDISDNATITVAGPPTITQHPVAANVKSGSGASFTCVASSDLIPAMSITSSDLPPMEFSWQKDGSAIIFSSSITVNKSRNMSTLTVNPVSTNDAGSYMCIVSNGARPWPVTSKAATLQVTDPPTITQDPGGAKVKSGSEASFSCVALSDLPMEFSWQKDSSGIIFSSSITVNTSGNMSTLILKNVSTTDAGSYTCTASNDAGSVTSNAATLQVTDPPTITQDPKETTVRSGSEASFTCVTSSDLPMKFSWQKDGSSIIFSPSVTVNTSGNMSTLILKPVSTTDAGSYTCTASNGAGSVTSMAATLQVTGGVIQKLKQSIPDDPPNWNPLPDCKSPVELAMIRVNRKEEQHPNTERVKNQVFGNVEKIMDSTSPGAVEVKACRIFDKGIFKDDGSIILLEGGPGMGKTTLGYSYCKKWRDGVLHEFDMAAFVPLRETDKEKVATFDDLLFPACGNDEVMKEELKQYMESGKNLLLVLDGWDEAPDIVRKSPGNFIRMLQQSISSQSKSKILITSRPDSSVNLDVNRVEIVGFTKDSIKKYFKEALRSHLNDKHEIEDGCKELENHLKTYPSIQSCCAIPLNAAIVARLFLASDKKPRTLPHTRHELFSSIIAHLINKEQEKHCASAHKVSYISCLEELPDSLKKPLCKLAFDHLEEIVIPHEMVASTQLVEHESANSNDASFNSATPILSPCLRVVLQTVDKRDLRSGGITEYHYFIHLSIQELLAAYHISQLGEDEQLKVFKDLLDEPRFSSVLQFYAAFTRLTNQGVRDIVTRIDLAKKQHILLTIMRCCFEANFQDQLLYQKINQRLNGELKFAGVALTPFDCMSVGYFLAFALRAGELLRIELVGCNIDDHSLDLLLGELSKHGKVCPACVMQGVTYLDIMMNNIGDDGITRLATALQANTTMKVLVIGCNCGITGIGAEFLGRALAVNSSIEDLYISNTSIGDDGVAHIANALETNTTMKALKVSNCGMSSKGAESLAKALYVNSSLKELTFNFNILRDNGKAHIATAFQANNTLKSLSLDDDIDVVTDKAVLSLGAALVTNTSMENIWLEWTCIHPDTTLKKMAEYIKKSTLRYLLLALVIPHAFGEPRMSLEEASEWLHCIEVGGKEFILSLEDSCLETFSLHHVTIQDEEYFMDDSILHVPYLRSQIVMSLIEAATSVNMTRKMNNLPEINFSIM